MNIKQIGFKRTFNLGNYENIAVELVADIQPGETVPLEVTFDPDFHKEPPGKFSRTVFVQTSEGIELEAKIHIEIKD